MRRKIFVYGDDRGGADAGRLRARTSGAVKLVWCAPGLAGTGQKPAADGEFFHRRGLAGGCRHWPRPRFHGDAICGGVGASALALCAAERRYAGGGILDDSGPPNSLQDRLQAWLQRNEGSRRPSANRITLLRAHDGKVVLRTIFLGGLKNLSAWRW